MCPIKVLRSLKSDAMILFVPDLLNKHEHEFLIETIKQFYKSLWKRASAECYGEIRTAMCGFDFDKLWEATSTRAD